MHFWKVFSIGASVLALGCGDAARIADTPDLTDLHSRYDSPTAVLDAQGAEDTLGEMPPLERVATGFRSAGYASRAVDGTGEAAAKRASEGLQLQGTVQATLRCPGSRLRPVYDEATNGSFDLTIGIQDSRIKRGIAGVANHCVTAGALRGVNLPVTVDGPFEFDLGEDVPLKKREIHQLLMVIDGTLDIDGTVLTNVSARWTGERLEFLYTREDGTTVVAMISAEGIAVRDHDTLWVCPIGGICAQP